jgi:hypothetical protein
MFVSVGVVMLVWLTLHRTRPGLSVCGRGVLVAKRRGIACGCKSTLAHNPIMDQPTGAAASTSGSASGGSGDDLKWPLADGEEADPDHSWSKLQVKRKVVCIDTPGK